MITIKYFITNQTMHLKREELQDGQKIIIKMFLFKEGIEYGEPNQVVK